MAKSVYKINDGSTDYQITPSSFFVCETAASTAAKVGNLLNSSSNEFTLATGVIVFVKFTYANSVANPTLNLNGTGAKSIKRYGTTAVSTSAKTSWRNGAVVAFAYDGTNWVMVTGIDDNSTYTVSDKTITLSAGNGLTDGGAFTLNQNSDETITFNVGAGNGITVSADAVSAKAGNGITVDSTGINHADTSTLSGSYGPTADVTGNNNATIVIPQITVDGYGHVTGVTNRTYTSKNTDNNTTYSFSTGDNNGQIKVDPSNADAYNVSVKGLGSLAYQNLDSSNKIPSTLLPSYVDDVIEGYYYNSKFYKESAHTTAITGESGKIYVDLSTNKTYRWSGSAFVEISASLALGETSSTAYRGDRGKIAYDHSQAAHAPSNAEKNVQSD